MVSSVAPGSICTSQPPAAVTSSVPSATSTPAPSADGVCSESAPRAPPALSTARARSAWRVGGVKDVGRGGARARGRGGDAW
jgi:hypothetical protein